MKNNRRIAALGGGLALLLAACSGGGDGASGSSTTPAAETTSAAATPSASAEQAVEGPLTIFAAASLQKVFEKEILPAFAAKYPEVEVQPGTYDGSSTLVTQLIEGAKADVLLTADTATMDKLDAAGLAKEKPVAFATNTLVIAVPTGNPLGIKDLADLAGKKYAICAPEVPCGAATTKLFEAAGIAPEAVSQEQNVTAVAERVSSGEADAGLVYKTDVASRSDKLEGVVPSGADAAVNTYPIALLDESAPAKAFQEFILGAEGQALLKAAGFDAAK